MYTFRSFKIDFMESESSSESSHIVKRKQNNCETIRFMKKSVYLHKEKYKKVATSSFLMIIDISLKVVYFKDLYHIKIYN